MNLPNHHNGNYLLSEKARAMVARAIRKRTAEMIPAASYKVSSTHFANGRRERSRTRGYGRFGVVTAPIAVKLQSNGISDPDTSIRDKKKVPHLQDI